MERIDASECLLHTQRNKCVISFFLFREIIAEWAQNDYNVLGKNQTFGNKSKIERSVQAQYIGMISEWEM